MGYSCSFDLQFPDVKPLFIYLLAIFVSSLEKCLFNFFTHIFISGYLCIFLLKSRSFLFSLDINFLSEIWFANLFSCSIGLSFALQKM